MITDAPSKPICLPPAPLNGGRLETAPSKVGRWVWQPKVDDRRVVIHAPTGTIWNQYGQPSVAMRDLHKFEKAINQIKTCARAEWLDAGLMEYRHGLMRGCVIVFDAMKAGLDYFERRNLLTPSFPILPADMAYPLARAGMCISDKVYVVNEWANGENIQQLWTWLQDQNRQIGHKFFEGLVAKKTAAQYPMFGTKPKTETPHWIKHRFDQ